MSFTSNVIDRLIKINSAKRGQDLELNNKYVGEIEPNAFKNCKNKRIRSLVMQKIIETVEIDGRIFSYKLDETEKKKRFRFNSNHLSLFEPLGEHLEELDVTCELECEFNFLEHLHNLRKLKLIVHPNKIEGKLALKEANNQLTHLDLSDSNLQISDKTMFNDLKCLKHLDLSKVKLADNVLPDLFKELKQLESLKLMKTKFQPSDDSFIHLANLKELHFVDIEIPEESSNIFVPLKRLEKLVMGKTDEFNYAAFNQLKNLRELKLFEYYRFKIDKNFLDNHPNLEHLNLSFLNECKHERNGIDLKALANLKSLKSLNLSDNVLHIGQDCEIFSLENLENLNLSLEYIKNDCGCPVDSSSDDSSRNDRDNIQMLQLNETTFKRMKNLKVLNLYGNQIKLEGDCFKHLTNLNELHLSCAILDSDNNNKDIDIFSSLKHLEKFKFNGIKSRDLFQLYRLSELVNLKELFLSNITDVDLDQFRKMLRSKPRKGEEVEPNPTYDDLCYFILRDMTKLKSLKLSHCKLTYINKEVLSRMKDLSILYITLNHIRHIPDDTFDCLSNLEEINLRENPIKQFKFNRLCLKLNKLRKVWFKRLPIVDLMDEQFNFKSIEKIDCDNENNLVSFYNSRRAFLQQNQIKISAILPALEIEIENVEQMFQSIDIKLNEIKSEKEKSIEQQLKPFVDQIKLEPVEDNLNQTREEMIKKLKEIHDNSINEINALHKNFKKPCCWSKESIREESMREAKQSAEKILQRQFKLPTNSYPNMPRLSNFFKLTHLNAFKSVKLVKYAHLMPELLRKMDGVHERREYIIPINKDRSLIISLSDSSAIMFSPITSYFKHYSELQFQTYDSNIGLIGRKTFDDDYPVVSPAYGRPDQDTFSIVNDHIVTVRKFDHKYMGLKFNDFISKFNPDRLKNNCTIECSNEANDFVSGIILIDVFDIYLNKISQATIKYCDLNESFFYTCGSGGILIESRSKYDFSFCFALYSLKMKLKGKRIKVAFKLKPIKFDDEKCYFYKHNDLDYSTSIAIYSFADSTLLQVIDISIAHHSANLMTIDSTTNSFFFLCFTSSTINCYNLESKELVKSQVRNLNQYFDKMILEDDERISLFK